MKLRIITLLYGCFLLCCNYRMYGQSGVVASGGDLAGPGLKVSYSIGQVDYFTVSGTEGFVTQGIQQPYEIYILKGKEITSINLSVYPNPTAGYLTLSINGNEDLQNMYFSIYDKIGQPILNQAISKKETGIELNKYSSGMYILKVFKDDSEIKTFKIINCR